MNRQSSPIGNGNKVFCDAGGEVFAWLTVERPASIFVQDDFQSKLCAAQELSDAVRSTKQRLVIDSGGNVILFHGTSIETAQAIRESGQFKEGTFFAPSQKAVMPHAKPKHSAMLEVLQVAVDPRDVEFSTGSGEFYVPSVLVKNEHGTWQNPERLINQFEVSRDQEMAQP